MGDDPAARTASEGFNLDNTTPRGETPTDGKQASPVVLQKLSPLRPTYSFPGSVANSDLYPKFRFITEDMMNEMMKEAKRASKGIHTKKDAIDMMLGRDLSRAQFDKCVKQIKWFWFEIEDYLREIETVYNEVRMHCQTFEARRKDAEEDAKRLRRVAEFNARSGRITYDLQQQIKDVFTYIDNAENKLNRSTMKKLHGIHRGVVTSLQNLLTRLPDYELDRGLPPAYHQLAMLIRRMAQCCYKLIFGRDIHIIRNLENIRQKVEEAIGQDPREVPLYQMTPDSKHVGPSGPLWSPNKPKAKTCPVVWQEYDAHMKGKRPPRDVPHKIMHMIDISKNQGFMAPIHLQSGIEKYLRIKVPQHNKAVKSLKASTSGKLNVPLNTEKLMSALGGPGGNLNDEQFIEIAQKLKKLQHEFVSEVEDEIQARLKPLLQEAKMVASAHAKKKIVNLAQMKVPLEGISNKKKIPFEFWQDTSTSKSSDLTAKQKAKMNEVIGYVNRPDSELTLNKSAVRGCPSTSKLNEAQAPRKRRGRSRSPVTIRRQNSSRSQLIVSPHSEQGLPFEGTITKPKSADRRSANKSRTNLKSKEGKKPVSSQAASNTLSKSVDNPNLYPDDFPSLQLNETNLMIDSDESQVRKDSDTSDILDEPRKLERRESEHHVGSAGDHLCKLQKPSENSNKSSSPSESSPTKSQQSRCKSSPGSARLMGNIKRPKETMVYMVHDVSRPSSGTGTPRGDDSSTRQRSRGSNINRQGSVGNDEVQWAMQGSLTLWAQGQLSEMLGKLQDMEDEECAIRNRWKDHLIVDPGTGGGNYRIAYGECPDFSEDKEPDAIVLMKPTDKDTVVVVSALPPSEDSKEDVGGARSAVSRGVGSKLVTDRSNQGLASPSLSGGDRVRAGRDPKDQQHFNVMLESIRAYREEFDKYLRRTSHYAVGNFNPWKVIEDVSDDILGDLFREIAVEIADIPDTCVKELYDAEFAQA